MAEDTRPRSTPKRIPLPQEEDARLESEDRRTFFRRSAAVAGGALAAGGLVSAARGAPLAIPRHRAGDGPAHRAGGVRHAVEVREERCAAPHRCLREPPELVRLEHDAAPVPARGHDAERTDLRAPPRRHAGHRPGDASPGDPRHGAPAAAVHDGRPDAVPGGLAVPFPRVLGQRAHRLAEERLDHGAADPRTALRRPVDRRSALVAARRGRRPAGREVAALRGRGRRGPHALGPARQGDGRRAHRLRLERRDDPARERLSAARDRARLGRQRLGQVAAAHQGRRPAVALPQRDGPLHRPDARRQVAPVQLRHGVQVGDHAAVRRDEARRPRTVRDPGLRLVRARATSRRSTSRSTAAGTGAKRDSKSRCSTRC